MPTQVEAGGPQQWPSHAALCEAQLGHIHSGTYSLQAASPALPIREGPSPALMCTWRLSHATWTVVSGPYLELWVGWAVTSHLEPPVPGTGQVLRKHLLNGWVKYIYMPPLPAEQNPIPEDKTSEWGPHPGRR